MPWEPRARGAGRWPPPLLTGAARGRRAQGAGRRAQGAVPGPARLGVLLLQLGAGARPEGRREPAAVELGAGNFAGAAAAAGIR